MEIDCDMKFVLLIDDLEIIDCVEIIDQVEIIDDLEVNEYTSFYDLNVDDNIRFCMMFKLMMTWKMIII